MLSLNSGRKAINNQKKDFQMEMDHIHLALDKLVFNILLLENQVL
jgi:hypothetical protein